MSIAENIAATKGAGSCCTNCKLKLAEIFQDAGDYCLQCWQEVTHTNVWYCNSQAGNEGNYVYESWRYICINIISYQEKDTATRLYISKK